MRAHVRRFVPFWIRWRLRQTMRSWRDRARGVRFARSGADVAAGHLWRQYTLPLVFYPGQQGAQAAKRSNIARSMASIDGTVVNPGETFSFWRAVGRPTERAGYARAAALRDGVLTEEVGGAICFVSTLVYNALLLSGMVIVERYCHSVDSYGDARYFALGRDSAVEYAYRDLRATNRSGSALVLRTRLEGDVAVVEAWSGEAPAGRIEIEVLPEAVDADPRLRVRTLRRLERDGEATTEDLGLSVYQQARSAEGSLLVSTGAAGN